MLVKVLKDQADGCGWIYTLQLTMEQPVRVNLGKRPSLAPDQTIGPSFEAWWS